MKKLWFALSIVAFSGASLSAAEEKNIVETAVSAGSFKTLAAALTAAGLVDTLKGNGPFTVFAPTDEAFAKLPPGTVANLLKPENKGMLIDILTYHVVSGNVPSGAAIKLTSCLPRRTRARGTDRKRFWPYWVTTIKKSQHVSPLPALSS